MREDKPTEELGEAAELNTTGDDAKLSTGYDDDYVTKTVGRTLKPRRTRVYL